MAPKTCSSLALFLALNLLFFALVSAGGVSCPSPKPKPPPSPKPKPPSGASCPRDTLKLGVCSNMLNGSFNFTMGLPEATPCCSFFHGLADFEVAVCLCTALKANILGFNINIPISFTNLVNVCSKSVPNNFICAPDN